MRRMRGLVVPCHLFFLVVVLFFLLLGRRLLVARTILLVVQKPHICHLLTFGVLVGQFAFHVLEVLRR